MAQELAMDTADHEVLFDGQTVWVNADTGECIGRFGWGGIDVHTTVAEQLAGNGQS